MQAKGRDVLGPAIYSHQSPPYEFMKLNSDNMSGGHSNTGFEVSGPCGESEDSNADHILDHWSTLRNRSNTFKRGQDLELSHPSEAYTRALTLVQYILGNVYRGTMSSRHTQLSIGTVL